MEADRRRAARQDPKFILVSYLVLWAGLMVFLAVLVVSGQLRQAEEAFDTQADILFREVDGRLEANEFVLEGSSAFLRVVGTDNDAALRAYTADVLARFPHIHLLTVQQRVARERVPDLVARMRERGHAGFQLRRLTPGAEPRWRPVPDKPFYLPTVFAVPARPEADECLGLDVDALDILRVAVNHAFAADRATASALFPLRDGTPGYVLFQPVFGQGQPAHDDVLVSLVVKAADLLPDLRTLPPGLEVDLASAHPSADDRGWRLLSAGPMGELERWLFPRLRMVRVFGSDAQPFVLTVSQQLGWHAINPLVAAAFGLATVLGFLMTLGYGRVRTRREEERQRSEQELYHLANYDSLTGLPNRNLFKDRLGQAVSRARRHGGAVALFFLDLDGFKAVNDTAGHEAGDMLLKQVAERLIRSVREQDTVARLSGDEFVVLLEDVSGRADGERVCTLLRDAFNDPFHIGTDDFLVTASIGLATFPEDGDDPAALLRKADEQMYAVKYPEWVAHPRR